MASVKGNTVSNYVTDITIRTHKIVADEPLNLNGNDLGPTPGELLASSLIACTNITLKMYAQRKEWPLEKVETTVDLNEKEATINRQINLSGKLSTEQKERLLQIADKCPIHKLLSQGIKISTVS